MLPLLSQQLETDIPACWYCSLQSPVTTELSVVGGKAVHELFKDLSVKTPYINYYLHTGLHILLLKLVVKQRDFLELNQLWPMRQACTI